MLLFNLNPTCFGDTFNQRLSGLALAKMANFKEELPQLMTRTTIFHNFFLGLRRQIDYCLNVFVKAPIENKINTRFCSFNKLLFWSIFSQTLQISLALESRETPRGWVHVFIWKVSSIIMSAPASTAIALLRVSCFTSMVLPGAIVFGPNAKRALANGASGA